MINELSRQQRKVLILLAGAIFLGAGRLGLSTISRGTVEVHLVNPVQEAWPGEALDRSGTEQKIALAVQPPKEAGLEAANAEVAKEGAPPSGGTTAEEPVSVLLDPNTATNAQLQTLPGIGPVLAARIIEYRETVGKFRTVDDLLAVKGIGEKTLAKIRPYLEIQE